MNSTEALLRQALALPDPERADLVAELLASLDERVDDDPTSVGELWRSELERRGQQASSGGTVGEKWGDLRGRLTDDLGG